MPLNTGDLKRSYSDLTDELPLRITILSTGGKTTVPKHTMKALKLRSTLNREDRVTWILKRGEVIVRKGAPRSSPTD